MGHQDRNYRAGNLVLNGEDVFQLAVVTLGPTMSPPVTASTSWALMRTRSSARRMLPSRT
jgi:hypothetical protein